MNIGLVTFFLFYFIFLVIRPKVDTSKSRDRVTHRGRCFDCSLDPHSGRIVPYTTIVSTVFCSPPSSFHSNTHVRCRPPHRPHNQPYSQTVHIQVRGRERNSNQKRRKTRFRPLCRSTRSRYVFGCGVMDDDDDVGAGQLQPPPEYIDQRIRLFERLRAEYDEFVKGVLVSLSRLSFFDFFFPAMS